MCAANAGRFGNGSGVARGQQKTRSYAPAFQVDSSYFSARRIGSS